LGEGFPPSSGNRFPPCRGAVFPRGVPPKIAISPGYVKGFPVKNLGFPSGILNLSPKMAPISKPSWLEEDFLRDNFFPLSQIESF